MISKYHDSDSSDTESFHSFDDNEPGPPRTQAQTTASSNNEPANTNGSDERFPPEEEASLLASSNSIKSSGNALFATGAYDSAIQTYDRALASCPNYLDYEIAVLRSNIAACHLKLQDWKDAVESATQGLKCLERMEPLPKLKKKKVKVGEAKGADTTAEGEEEEDDNDATIQELDDTTAARLERLANSQHTLDAVRKLQIKLLLRRAKSRAEQGGWSDLQGAEEDYHTLLHPAMEPCMAPMDRRQVMDAARRLGPRLEEAKQREMAEMMNKLKGLGNTILKPFGLSTSNFQFVKDEKSGGYSMNFSQNPSSGK